MWIPQIDTLIYRLSVKVRLHDDSTPERASCLDSHGSIYFKDISVFCQFALT